MTTSPASTATHVLQWKALGSMPKEPKAHAWPISLRSKRARFSETYGLNNASALVPQGWTG